MQSTSQAAIPTRSAYHRGVMRPPRAKHTQIYHIPKSLDKVEAEVQQLRRLLLPDIESLGVKNSNLHFVDK